VCAVALVTPSHPRFSIRKPVDRAEAQETERQLLVQYHLKGDLAAREELARRFLPLARDLALRYTYTDEPFDDLLQVASLGLIKAIDRFEPGRGTKFTSYAAPTILGELKRHFRDRGWSVHVPRDVQERILKVERAMADLPAKLGRSPTVQDIAKRVEATDEEVLEAMHAAQGHHAVSLDATSTLGDGDEPGPLRDRIGEEDLAFDTVEYGEAIGPVLDEISERDRKVLHLRFVEDMTQSEIAERVGVSQMHVSRILRATIEKLRQRIPEED
jgi:RNA polymerase sigma-B factor